MKKNIAIAMLVILALFTSCGSSVGSTPEETVQKFYTSIQQSDYETAADMFSPLIVNVFFGRTVHNGSASDARTMRVVELMDNPGDGFNNAYKGIKTITIDNTAFNSDNTKAEVIALLTFGIDPNYTLKTKQTLTKQDGKWYLTKLSF